MHLRFNERTSGVAACALLLLSGAVAPIAGQDEVSIAAGAAFPTGSTGRERSIGPALTIGTGVEVASWMLVRMSFTAAQLQGEAQPTGSALSNYGDLRVGGLFLQAVVGSRTGLVHPYGVIGVGPYWMKNMSGVENPYGMVWGGTAGAGMALEIGRVQPFVEFRYDLIASDFGAEEWSPTTYAPLQFGVRWAIHGNSR